MIKLHHDISIIIMANGIPMKMDGGIENSPYILLLVDISLNNSL